MVRQHSRRVSDRLPPIPNNGILKPFQLNPEKMTYLRVVSPKSSQYLPFLGLVQSNFVRRFNSPAQEPVGKPSSQKVSAIVDEISGLTLLEVADLTELLRKKLGVSQMPLVSVMMPGMGFSLRGMGKGGGGAAAAVAEEKKEEKTAFDLKLEAGFEAASKIKIIKEVRSFTDLGLKEAKDLVEKAPTVLKKGVSKEDAEKIIEKMKAIGAKVIME